MRCGLKVEFLEEPHVNTNAGHREAWIRYPDGYVVVLASAYGDIARELVQIP
jgi:hypothetical protein